MTKEEIKENAARLNDRANEEVSFVGFERVENPIIKEVEDLDKIRKFFETESFIPYAGTNARSGHTLLSYFDNMAILSPTAYAIMQSKINTSFAGKPHLIKNADDIFSEDEIITDAKVTRDVSTIIKGIGFDRGSSIKDLPRSITEGLFNNGNSYIEVVLAEVLGNKVAAIYVHKQRNVLYTLDSGEYRDLVGISALWDSAYIKKYKPTKIPIYPEMKQFKDGTIRTIIHAKTSGGKYYGRPRNQGCFYEVYSEHQAVEYRIKQAANEFSGRLLLEVEDGDTKTNRMIDNGRDQKAGYTGTYDRWEKHLTMKSKDPRSFVLMTRPYGSKPFKSEKIPPMTNSDYHKTIKEMDVETIIRTHGWSKHLLGDSKSSGISSNMLLDAFELVNKTEVPNIQADALQPINTALKLIYSWFGREDLTDYSINYGVANYDKNDTNGE